MTNTPDPIDYPMNDNSLTNLIAADLPQIDTIFTYARDTARELIIDTIRSIDTDPLDPNNISDMTIARSISADRLESASFTNLPCDPELLYCLISLILCDRLNCNDSDLCADY